MATHEHATFSIVYLWLPAERQESGTGERRVHEVQQRRHRQADEGGLVQDAADRGGRPPHVVQVHGGHRDAADYACERSGCERKCSAIAIRGTPITAQNEQGPHTHPYVGDVIYAAVTLMALLEAKRNEKKNNNQRASR